jgi:galactose-1-phosphate uridylyltransferase
MGNHGGPTGISNENFCALAPSVETYFYFVLIYKNKEHKSNLESKINPEKSSTAFRTP